MFANPLTLQTSFYESGDYVGGYRNSLYRMYAAYSISLILSTLFNIIMTKAMALPHYVTWIVTLLWTGIANYFILKKTWTYGSSSSTVVVSPSSG
jgi:hypothetical protein